jgi:hypothetical protein
MRIRAWRPSRCGFNITARWALRSARAVTGHRARPAGATPCIPLLIATRGIALLAAGVCTLRRSRRGKEWRIIGTPPASRTSAAFYAVDSGRATREPFSDLHGYPRRAPDRRAVSAGTDVQRQSSRREYRPAWAHSAEERRSGPIPPSDRSARRCCPVVRGAPGGPQATKQRTERGAWDAGLLSRRPRT